MRYSTTERLGVNETEKIIIKDIGWIFREQTIEDFGTDAIIEQVIDGDPTAKLIGVQIKTGKSHFNFTEKDLTYYATTIHYKYWLSSNIPMIFVAHIPETGKTYWEHITRNRFQKTKTNWKFRIPINQELNNKSLKRLNNILNSSESNYQGEEEYKKTDLDYLEDIHYISQAKECAIEINSQISELGIKANECNSNIIKIHKDNLSLEDQNTVKKHLNNFANDLKIISKRLETKILQFSELYTKGFAAYVYFASSDYIVNKNKESLQLAIDSFTKNAEAIEIALKTIEDLKSDIEILPNFDSKLKDSKADLICSFELMINEFTTAHEISNNSSRSLDQLSLGSRLLLKSNNTI